MPGKKLANKSITIKENSWLAAIAAKKLSTKSVAMVLGNTIYLHGAGKEEFLQYTRWLKHELCHLQQYRQHGYIGFIVKYLWQTIRNGYYNNKYEIAARAEEEL